MRVWSLGFGMVVEERGAERGCIDAASLEDTLSDLAVFLLRKSTHGC